MFIGPMAKKALLHASFIGQKPAVLLAPKLPHLAREFDREPPKRLVESHLSLLKFTTVDGRNPAPPKKPWNDDSLVHTNKRYGFRMASKWCGTPPSKEMKSPEVSY